MARGDRDHAKPDGFTKTLKVEDVFFDPREEVATELPHINEAYEYA